MPTPVHYIPIVTTLLAVPFSLEIFRRWRAAPAIDCICSGGPSGWRCTAWARSPKRGPPCSGGTPFIFKSWYISGALLGGAPLAQGTVYLLLKRRTAHLLTAALMLYVVVASVAVVLAPIDLAAVEPHRLTGRVFGWQWVRLFSPAVNLYAVVFLIGGAVLSALRYSLDPATRHRMYANILIAIGAILPGIGGTATRMGHTEVLYVTELIGLVLTWMGYRISIRPITTQYGIQSRAASSTG